MNCNTKGTFAKQTRLLTLATTPVTNSKIGCSFLVRKTGYAKSTVYHHFLSLSIFKPTRKAEGPRPRRIYLIQKHSFEFTNFPKIAFNVNNSILNNTLISPVKNAQACMITQASLLKEYLTYVFLSLLQRLFR